ncbi:proton-translocating NADH-quinone oxidoreductase, chain L [Denitrovibrio acetiphilus DSM 12809]|uniref:Proton-translocating NADH-quinone oxidoreductase, chain L n=1 Tax=Denitrovibrio acetiphilus (strain DSM 12809 / NBRC 114555 / N2460) TaxID=522772 RepID=D4H180_DENA2|nr:NADH-quinone oxidoreductase subunit L [Denitrovibrio acetiphilus]ADD66828.1 proton-translocating NADH-quinone oxidoreductase, chain L [Denitrovibrio acetiphilus DSM 12809]
MIFAVLTLLGPLVAFLINGLLGRRYIKNLAPIVAIAGVSVSFVCALILFYLVSQGFSVDGTLYTWVVAGKLSIPFGILVDPLSSIMLIVVTTISLMVHIYSIGYMHGDPGFWRFFTYLSVFTLSMLVLVLGNNFLMLFVGWELVGLSSYLLIGFWFHKKSAADACKKAFVMNRIGDFGFYIGLLLVIVTFRSVNYSDAFNSEAIHHIKEAGFMLFGMKVSLIDLMTFGLFCGAMGKSAQFPLHTWLPDAMEGPTPVSALIHAATMVTAGVYMVARCNALFSEAHMTSQFIVFAGAMTAFLGASIGLTQYDLKRILAYSTVSQLGYMIMATGVGAYVAAIFHLFTHAMFKGLLFLCSGSVMHAMHDQLDVRLMGGLKKKMPFTHWTYLIGCIAIAGIPPLAGFWSKDEILAMTFASGHNIAWFVGTAVAGMTAFYMFRSYFLVFQGTPRDQHLHDHAHESPFSMWGPLVFLAFLSIFVGLVFGYPLENGYIHTFLGPVLTPAHAHPHHMAHSTATMLMILSIAVAAAGIFVSYLFYVKNFPALPEKTVKTFKPLHKFLLNKWYFDELYDFLFVHPIVMISNILWRAFDVNVIDFTVNAFGRVPMWFGGVVRHIQTGRIQTYIFTMVIGIIVFVTIFYTV